MTTQALILAIAQLVVGAIVTIGLAYVAALVSRQQKVIGDVKDDLTSVKTTVADVVLKFDPITRTLDGQLSKMQEQIEKFGNQKGRTELLAEQAITDAAVKAAMAESAAAALPQQAVAAPAPIEVSVVPNPKAPVPVVVQTVADVQTVEETQ